MSDFSVYKKRRLDLAEKIKSESESSKPGSVLVFAGCEDDDRNSFFPDSTFYYLTGLREPGLVLLIDYDGSTTLLVPNYNLNRSQWVGSSFDFSHDDAASRLGISSIESLGDSCPGYSMTPIFKETLYARLLERLKACSEGKFCTVQPSCAKILYLTNCLRACLGSGYSWADVSPSLARMRRRKTEYELQAMRRAVKIAARAHSSAKTAIGAGGSESFVRAAVCGTFVSENACSSFPPIVASGLNSCTLHYESGDRKILEGDVVLVDIGASVDSYASDVTRTYPASGKFTKRQQEVYDIVLPKEKKDLLYQ